MKKNSAFKNKKVFLTWIMSYSLILIIPILINLAIYFQVYKIVSKYIMGNNSAILNQMKFEMDEKLKELSGFYVKVSLDANIKYLRNLHGEAESYIIHESVQKLFNANDSIALYAPINCIANYYFIFFNNSNLVWYNSGLYNKKLFTGIDTYSSIINSEKWDEFCSRRDKQYITRYTNGSGKKMVAIVMPLSTGSINNNANMVYVMNDNAFSRYMSNITELTGGTVYVVDDKNNVVFSSLENNEKDRIELGGKFDSSEGSFRWKMNGTDAVVNYTSSGVYPWKYVSIVPEAALKEQSAQFQKTIFIGVFLSFFIGIFVIKVLLSKNYNPVKELISTISGAFDDKKYSNEFQYIKDSIVNIYEKNESMVQKVMQQNKTVQLNYIDRLLHGSLSNTDISDDVIRSLGITFISENFLVVLCYVEGKRAWMDSHYDLVKNGYAAFFENYVLQPMRTNLGENYLIYYSENGDLSALLLNISDDACVRYKEELSYELSSISNKLKNEMEFTCSFSISRHNRTIHSISIAYNEAMHAIEYKILGSKSDILFMDYLEGMENSIYNYKYTVEEEQKIINCIRIGDFDNASVIVNTIFDNNISESVLSVNKARCIIYDVISTFIKAINNDKMLERIGFLDEIHISEIMSGRKSVNEMRGDIIKTLGYICNEVRSYKQKDDRADMTKRVELLIENYFKDENLGVAFIAEEIGLNPKYLSAVYREIKGESILDTLHKRRIREIKKLFAERNVSIAEVLKHTGYSSENSLIRVFKKYEGITPGQFKDVR